MRVFALSTWFPHPTINGSTLRAYHLLRALAARHEVDLAAFTPFGPPADHSLEHLRSFCRSVVVISRSPFAANGAHRAGLLSLTPRSLAATYVSAVHAMTRSASAAADAVIAFQLGASRYLDGVSRATIFEEAEPTSIEHLWRGESSPVRRVRRRLTWWKHAAYLRRLIDRVDGVTVVSDVERAALVRIGCEPSSISVIPNGAEASDLTRPRTSPAPRIVYAGSVTYRANLDAVTWFLRDVLPRVRAEHPQVEFWVTGATEGVQLDALPNRALARFTGQIPDVKDVIGDARVCVAPILGGGGTRLKILEALALGVPVVSTRKGVEGLDVDDGEHVLVADTAEAFADRVGRILEDDDIAARLSRAGRARVAKKYTWSVIGDQLNTVVAKTVEQWRSRPRRTAR
jgi:glycosyltransferase involved in cell wall biosynthesis